MRYTNYIDLGGFMRSGFSPFHERSLESGASGFSLVELSIVLVILGLLTGGILTGQNLIRAAELRAVTTEFQTYQTAVMTFRDKYFALPGDMTNATDFWGSAGGSGTIGDGCEAATGSGSQTCNGNNDGTIDVAGGGGEYGENFTFWQHLVNAGLIEGSYTGITGSGGAADATPGENLPISKLSNAGWSIRGTIGSGGSATLYAINYGNAFIFGAKSGSTGDMLGPTLLPEEAWNIDKKIDDGLPAYGQIVAFHWNNTCGAANDGTHANNDIDASYNISNDSKQCAIFFREQF
jgi:prepilin-type N-terminal cleavage/methylation domain-containing protein